MAEWRRAQLSTAQQRYSTAPYCYGVARRSRAERSKGGARRRGAARSIVMPSKGKAQNGAVQQRRSEALFGSAVSGSVLHSIE